MIRRNTASQPILIGPLLATEDGAEQTTGAAIAVRKDGTDVGSPGGTLSHVASGVWQYTPTQGETDCAILGLILTKTGATPVALNVLTTTIPVQVTPGTNGGLPTVDSNNYVAGIQGTKNKLDDLNDFDPTTDTVAHVTLVDTCTENSDMRGTDNASTFDPGSDTVTVGSNQDKTGYSLSSDYDAAKTAAQAGDQMDLVDSPNATAIAVIQSGLSTLDAAGVRQAVGLDSANLDDQLAAIVEDTGTTIPAALSATLKTGTAYEFTQSAANASSKSATVTITEASE